MHRSVKYFTRHDWENRSFWDRRRILNEHDVYVDTGGAHTRYWVEPGTTMIRAELKNGTSTQAQPHYTLHQDGAIEQHYPVSTHKEDLPSWQDLADAVGDGNMSVPDAIEAWNAMQRDEDSEGRG